MPGGRFIGVECKIGRDKLRPEQVGVHVEISKRDGVGVTVYDTVDDLVALIDDLRPSPAAKGSDGE
jgi:hypothetical protein